VSEEERTSFGMRSSIVHSGSMRGANEARVKELQRLSEQHCGWSPDSSQGDFHPPSQRKPSPFLQLFWGATQCESS
jgi:hypothetical protein